MTSKYPSGELPSNLGIKISASLPKIIHDNYTGLKK